MINVGGSFNPMSLPPVQREWGGPINSSGPGGGNLPPGMRMHNSSGGNTPGNLSPQRFNSSGPGGGNLPPMGGGGFGGGNSMMGGGGGGMVQGPSFMQQPSGGYAQPARNRMAGGMVDPSFRNMMQVKSNMQPGGTFDRMQQGGFKPQAPSPGMFPGISSSIYNQHFDPTGRPVQPQQQQQQNMGMGGGDPMQMMMQMMPFWQMYSQMLGNRGGQQGY